MGVRVYHPQYHSWWDRRTGTEFAPTEFEGRTVAMAEVDASLVPDLLRRGFELRDATAGFGTVTPLPGDFPARAALVAAGFDSLEAAHGASDDELLAVRGVGKAALRAIREL
jgi:hypothetical protein